jgi:hypothetical protein
MAMCAPAPRAWELSVGRVRSNRFSYGPPSMHLPGAQMKSVNLPTATGAERHRGLQPAAAINTGRIALHLLPWPSARSSLPRSRHAVHDSDWLAQYAQASSVSPVARLGSIWHSLGVCSRSWGLLQAPSSMLQGGPSLRAINVTALFCLDHRLRRAALCMPYFKALVPSSYTCTRRCASDAVHTRIRYSYHLSSKILISMLLACPAAEDNRFAGWPA